MYMGMGDASSGGTSSAIPTSTAPQVWFSIGGSADQWGDLTATDQANWLASARLAYAAGALPSLPAVSDAQAAAAGAKQSGTSSTGSSVGSGLSSLPWWAWALAGGVVLMLVVKD